MSDIQALRAACDEARMRVAEARSELDDRQDELDKALANLNAALAAPPSGPLDVRCPHCCEAWTAEFEPDQRAVTCGACGWESHLHLGELVKPWAAREWPEGVRCAS